MRIKLSTYIPEALVGICTEIGFALLVMLSAFIIGAIIIAIK